MNRSRYLPAKMMLCVALIIAALTCMAKANEELISPYDMTMSHLEKSSTEPPQTPASSACCGLEELKHSLAQLIQEQQDTRSWFGEMLKILNQLLQENKEVSGVQAEVLKVLRASSVQSEQQLQHLQSMARLQSLLVENHQALLLQVSRIAGAVQDAAKKQRK